MPPGFLILMVIGAALFGSAVGGPRTAVVLAVVGSIAAAVLQIRALGRRRD